MSRPTRALGPALPLLLAGCALFGADDDERPGPRLAPVPADALVPLLDAERRPAGLAVVVRVTTDRLVLLAFVDAAGPPGRLLVSLGEEQLPVDPGAPLPGSRGSGAGPVVAVLDVPRRAPGARPVGPAARPAAGAAVTLVTSPGGPGTPLALQLVEVAEAGPDAALLAPVPFASAEDVRTAEARAQALRGAVAFAADGTLLGFVTGARGDQPVVTTIEGLPDLAAHVGRRPGRDVLAPGDEAATLRLTVDAVEGRPSLPDGSWGGPDLFLSIASGDERLPPLPLDAAAIGSPVLARVGGVGPALARLVERDVTLAEGEVDEPLAEPAKVDLGLPRARLSFRLSDAVLERLPPAERAGARVVRVGLRVERFDPDHASGEDRTPLGAQAAAVALGRVASGALDPPGGDGTDFWCVDVSDPDAWPRDAALLLFHRDPDARLSADVFAPDFGAPLLRIEPRAGRRLAIVRGTLPAGRVFLRIAAADGAGGEGPRPLRYAALVGARDDAAGLVRGLFRLVAREAEGSLPYLGSREFAREVAVGLAVDAALDPGALAGALLDELGHRVLPARLLALTLLEAHFPPPPEALRAIADRGGGARALDAGLLITTRRADDARIEAVVAAAASADEDPVIKLRVLDVAARVLDDGRRARLLEALAKDDASGLVRRAIDRLAPR